MATASKQSPTKDPANGSVRVEIFDQVYNLRGSDADYILKLAEYVDGKMRAVSEQTVDRRFRAPGGAGGAEYCR